MALGDNFNCSVDHFDGGLVVYGVRWPPETGRPFFCGGHGVLRQELVVHVREDREVDDAQRAVVTAGWLPPDEVLPDPRRHDHAPGAESYPDRLAQRRQKV